MAGNNNGSWVGGEFVKAPQWGSGRSNSGDGKKKYGNAGMRKRNRFNPNPTPKTGGTKYSNRGR